ncbi:MAG: type II toxin-antitoxin system VapC family toxin [bacterium]
MTLWLVDTGPLVAYLDAADPAHGEVSSRWDGFSGRLATTSAVVTEAMQLVAGDSRGPGLLAELLADGAFEVYDLCQPPEVRQAVDLMERYLNLPMDFADATLLLLAEGLGVDELLTLDRRGFSAFRTRRGKPLRLVLDLE